MPKSFQALIEMAIERSASDFHMSGGLPPSARIDGAIVPLLERRYSPEEIEKTAYSIMGPAQKQQLQQNGEVDFAYSVPSVGRFRVNAFRQRGTLAMAVRILSPSIPDAAELGIPQSVIDMCDKRRGLVLVTGATGSGKSTTLASLIHIINHRYRYHIITLEDPIEYLHRHQKCIVHQREMGSDSQSYATALRAALREDPDVILVGEMRDLETISIAITAAETGHLVLSTLHTVGAANTIDRIIDVFPPYQQQQIRTQLAAVLECVVSQQLLPCASRRGRIAAIEVMLSNPAIRNHIREAKTYQIMSAMQTSRKAGMVTMDDALMELFQRGEITEDDALHYSQDRIAMAKRLI